MLSNQYFNIDRFIHVLRRDLSIGGRTTWIVGGAIVIVLLFLALSYASDQDTGFHESFYPTVLLIGGFVLTSISFNEMIKPESRQFYLGLPASNLEKFLSKWLITWIAYAVGVTLAYWILSLLMIGLSQYFFNFEFERFNLFDEVNWLYFKIYLVAQSFFLLGAIAFRKFTFFKTYLAFTIISLVFIACCFLIYKMVLWDYQEGLFDADLVSSDGKKMVVNKKFTKFMEGPALKLLEFFAWFLLAPIIWVIAYFKWTEQEV